MNVSIYDPFHADSTVECELLKKIGIYLVILLILGTFFNFLLLWIYLRNKEICNQRNALSIIFIIASQIGLMCEAPFVAYNSFSCGYV